MKTMKYEILSGQVQAAVVKICPSEELRRFTSETGVKFVTDIFMIKTLVDFLA